MQAIKITDLGSHMRVDWPTHVTHTWRPRNENSFHDLVQDIANAIGDNYNIITDNFARGGPVPNSAKVGGRNNALRAILPMLSQPELLYNINLCFAMPLPGKEVMALIKGPVELQCETGPVELQCESDQIAALCDMCGVSVSYYRGAWHAVCEGKTGTISGQNLTRVLELVTGAKI